MDEKEGQEEHPNCQGGGPRASDARGKTRNFPQMASCVLPFYQLCCRRIFVVLQPAAIAWENGMVQFEVYVTQYLRKWKNVSKPLPKTRL